MACEVGQVGQAPADQRIDFDAFDRAWSHRIAIGGVVDRHAGQRGRHENLVLCQHGLDRVIHLAADRLGLNDVAYRQFMSYAEPVQIFGR